MRRLGNEEIWKGERQDCILSSCLFSLYAEYIRRNARLDEVQAGIKIAGKIPITSHMQMIAYSKVETLLCQQGFV